MYLKNINVLSKPSHFIIIIIILSFYIAQITIKSLSAMEIENKSRSEYRRNDMIRTTSILLNIDLYSQKGRTWFYPVYFSDL